MWYKNACAVGIKQKFGERKQVIYFGGNRCKKSQEALMAIGEQCVEKLNEGMAEAAVKEWAVSKAKEDS